MHSNLFVNCADSGQLPSPRRWHSWGPMEAALPELVPIERSLAWPQGTLAVLEASFRLGLDRFTGWDLSAVMPAWRAAFCTAAKYFKRGVSAADCCKLDSLAGGYSIYFHSSAALPDPSDLGFCIFDKLVQKLWPDLSAKGVGAGYSIEAVEANKTLTIVGALLESWRAQGQQQDWTVIGGGLSSDVAAFAAHLVGARFRLMPTTLLSMVDAAVGGKCGVNFYPYGKNQIGTFAQPIAVDIYPRFLASLPPRQLRSGRAEALKHLLLSGSRLELSPNDTPSSAILAQIVAYKVAVVERDPFEENERAILNFGHTLGHALEAYSQAHVEADSVLLHGEAVALGMAFASILSKYHAGLSELELKEILGALQNAAVLPSCSELAIALGGEGRGLSEVGLWSILNGYMSGDKKADKKVEWVLLRRPGQPLKNGGRYTHQVPNATVDAAWAEFCAWFQH